jgi:WD40 repeat protein
VDAIERERQGLYDRAEARRLAGQAELARLSGQVSLSVVLALGVASIHRTPTLEGDLALRRALEYAATPLGGGKIGEFLTHVDIDDAGTMLACSDIDGPVHILDIHSREEVTTLPHSKSVGQVAFAANGKRLIVVVGTDQPLQAWLYDTDSWRLLAKLDSPAMSCKVAVSPDGRAVAVAAGGAGAGGVRVYDTARGQQLHALQDSRELLDFSGMGPNWASAAAFAPDGDHLAVAWRKNVSVFDLTSGGESILEVPDVRALTFNHTGTLLACTSFEHVTVYDLPAGREINLGELSRGFVSAMVFGTCRGGILAIARSDIEEGIESGSVDLISVHQGTLIRRIALDRGIGSAAFGADDATIAVGGDDTWVRVFDVASGRLLACYDHDAKVGAVRFTPDRSVLASAGHDGALWLFAPVAGAERVVFRPGNRARTCAFTTDSASLLVGGLHCGLSIWSLESGQRTHQLMKYGVVNDIALDRDGVVAASVGPDQAAIHTVVVFRYPDITESSALRFEAAVTSVALSPDGSLAAVGQEDHTVHIVEIGSSEHRQVIRLDGKPWPLAFSPDGKRLATGSHTDKGMGVTQLFDVSAGTEIFQDRQNGPVSAITFSPDGSRIAASGWDATVRIRDAATGTEQLHLGHNDSVSDVRFSPDGTVLASGSHDGDVRIFDARTGVELSRIHHPVGKDEWVNAVAISPDGSLVASAGDDGAVRLWPLGAALVEQAQERIARAPTQAERERYFAEAPETPEAMAETGKPPQHPMVVVPRAPVAGLKRGEARPAARMLHRWVRWAGLTKATRSRAGRG